MDEWVAKLLFHSLLQKWPQLLIDPLTSLRGWGALIYLSKHIYWMHTPYFTWASSSFPHKQPWESVTKISCNSQLGKPRPRKKKWLPKVTSLVQDSQNQPVQPHPRTFPPSVSSLSHITYVIHTIAVIITITIFTIIIFSREVQTKQMSRWVDKSVVRWMDGWMDGQTDKLMNVWINRQLDKWKDG